VERGELGGVVVQTAVWRWGVRVAAEKRDGSPVRQVGEREAELAREQRRAELEPGAALGHVERRAQDLGRLRRGDEGRAALDRLPSQGRWCMRCFLHAKPHLADERRQVGRVHAAAQVAVQLGGRAGGHGHGHGGQLEQQAVVAGAGRAAGHGRAARLGQRRRPAAATLRRRRVDCRVKAHLAI